MAEQQSSGQRDPLSDQQLSKDEQADQRYGLTGEYGQHGSLETGYGQSQQMGEDEWSAERYAQQAKKVDRCR